MKWDSQPISRKTGAKSEAVPSRAQAGYFAASLK
jgi:hypothetical protein